MEKHLVLVIFLLSFQLKAIAECTLNRPGPFLKPQDKSYKSKLTEDSSEESVILPSGMTLTTSTYGCEDNWGWIIKIKSSEKTALVKSLEEAFKLIESSLTGFRPEKLAEYDIEKYLKDFALKIDKEEFKKLSSTGNKTICARLAALSPKECAMNLKLEFTGQLKEQFVTFKFEDLEN